MKANIYPEHKKYYTVNHKKRDILFLTNFG